MSESSRRVIDQRLVRAVGHPLRVEILEVLLAQSDRSPTQIAKHLERRLGNVSYHVNVLRDCEVIELVGTRPRRGAIEHFFRPAASIQGFVEMARAAFGAEPIDGGGAHPA
jgi:DNA-binding transcriptional ArsR family regulator